VGSDVTPADLVASAQAAFVRAAASEPPMPGGFLVEAGRRLTAAEVLARASGNLLALPWREDREAIAQSILDDLDEVTVLSDPSATAAELVTAIRAGTAGNEQSRRRALLVNVDAADFVYSFQFARSVERRCVERGLRVDRIATDPSWHRDLSDELGQPVPEPIADGTETFVHSEEDPAAAAALRRRSRRHYEVAIVNVWPKLFYDLVTAGVLDGRTLIWDRHLHDGLGDETRRRGLDPASLRQRPIRVWSLQGLAATGVHPDLVQAGLIDGHNQHWPMDAEFFRSDAMHQPDLVFAGGDSARDYPLLIEAIRDLPLRVHLVTRHVPPALPPQVRVDVRLPLWRFRDAMAAASIAAIPLREGAGAAGLTVLTMAMALGVAVVSTESTWITQYAEDERDALLVPAGDVDRFRESIVRLHRDRELRERLTANARRRVAEICDLNDA
jgi:hypothetical protein